MYECEASRPSFTIDKDDECHFMHRNISYDLPISDGGMSADKLACYRLLKMV